MHMTGKGHMIAGSCLIVINDRILHMASGTIDACAAQLQGIFPGLSSFHAFEAYRSFIMRVWIPKQAEGTWMANSLTVTQLCLFLVIFWLGCFLPDIDQPNSTFGQHFYLPVKHRTWTHTIWAAALFLIPGIWIPPLFWLGYAYFLHLVVDAFSRGGVCFFYPISKYVDYPSGAHVKKHHMFKLYKPGGTSETVACALLVIAAAMLAAGPFLIRFIHTFSQNANII